jgi:hypothetical protein
MTDENLNKLRNKYGIIDAVGNHVDNCGDYLGNHDEVKNLLNKATKANEDLLVINRHREALSLERARLEEVVNLNTKDEDMNLDDKLDKLRKELELKKLELEWAEVEKEIALVKSSTCKVEETVTTEELPQDIVVVEDTVETKTRLEKEAKVINEQLNLTDKEDKIVYFLGDDGKLHDTPTDSKEDDYINSLRDAITDEHITIINKHTNEVVELGQRLTK